MRGRSPDLTVETGRHDRDDRRSIVPEVSYVEIGLVTGDGGVLVLRTRNRHIHVGPRPADSGTVEKDLDLGDVRIVEETPAAYQHDFAVDARPVRGLVEETRPAGFPSARCFDEQSTSDHDVPATGHHRQ